MTDVTRSHPGNHGSELAPRRRGGWALRRAVPLAGAALAAAMAAACSSLSSLSGGGPAPAASNAPASSGGSFTSRVTAFFTGDSGKLSSPAPASTTGAAGSDAAAEIDCPGVEYRQGASTWSVNGSSAENSALGLKYQTNFINTARECALRSGNLTIKVGVQGRIVVGPAGSAEPINVPLRYALVREGLQPKTLWTKLYMVPVSVDPNQPNLTWMHVEEEMTVPRPSDEDLGAMVVYIGFDPDGAKPVKPAPKPKSARSR